MDFPVRRPHGKDHSPVIALKSEIDLWFRIPHGQHNATARRRRNFEAYRRLLNNTRVLETRTATLINSREVLVREINRAMKLASELRSAGGPVAPRN